MLRLTPEQFTNLQARLHESRPKQRETEGEPKKRRNKFGAEATTIQGIRFDSKAEAERYMVLKDEERRGKIEDLQIQVRFNLLPAQGKERPVDYIADFVYIRDGSRVVEDVKSGPTKTREFVLKRKMMLFFHGIKVLEVMAE